MSPTAVKDQLALDEEVITNPDVEAALEERQRRKDSLAAVRAQFTEAHNKATAALTMIELPDDGSVARVGRFRITRSTTPARVVSFETEAKTRTRIAVVDDD